MQRDSIDFSSSDVGKLFRRFLFPTVMGMVFSAVFVITDGIFVGRGIGSDALASVNIVAPLFTLGTGLGLMFGMGGSVVASINLAQGKRRVAEINITQSLVLPALLIALLSALLIHWHEPLLLLLGTPGELMVPAREYLVWFTLFLAPLAVFNILMFIVRLGANETTLDYTVHYLRGLAPFALCFIVSYNMEILVKTDGYPRIAIATVVTGCLTNCVLDYLAIFVLNWGVWGAAVATGIGYVVGSGVILWYMFRRSRTLRFVKLKISGKSMRLTVRNLWYMSYIGFPALLSELAISCLMVVGNYTFIRYTGKDGVAAYSIACYIFPIIFMVYNGIIQSAQPIISYNYGAGLMRRGRKALRMALGTAALCGAAAFGFTWLCSPWIVGLFLTPDAPAYAIAVRGLPLFAAGYPFFGINVVTIGYYQSIERGRLATGLTVLRGIVLMAFCFLVLPRLAGVAGIWLAVPAAELAVTLLLLVLLRIGYGMRR